MKIQKLEEALLFLNNIDKELIDSSATNLSFVKNLISGGRTKCSKSAMNNVLYLLKNKEPCKLHLGTFKYSGDKQI